MKPIAALIALLALALGAAPAAADERLAVESAPFTADAFGDVIAWSSYDPALKTYSLRLLRGGQPITPAVEPSSKAFDLDVGPGPDGAPLVVYARAGDLFQFDPATGLEQPLAEVNTHAIESSPSIHRSALAFVRDVHRKPVVYLRKDGNTRRQPRPRFKHTLEVDGLELSSRGVFVTYRTDIVPTCCTRATLYRVIGGRLRHVFAVGSGGANFGQIVTPTVFGRNVYFGRTNNGSGQGNNLFRYDLGSRKLFAARGTSRALSLTWRGDRFLMSRSGNGCEVPLGAAPTTPPSCELLLKDPTHFTRASHADQRRTRP
ncbi:MAG: hypothetical protein ABI611_10650 [Solirubrobacteraceae bacterium]